MKCPNCGLEQAGVNAECSGCQLNFAKYNETQYKRQQAAPAIDAAAKADEEGISGSVWLALIGVAFACLWAYAWPKSGLPVPAGAHRNEKFHFAISPIPGWELNSKEKTDGADTEALEMMKAAEPGSSPAIMGVTVISQNLPIISDRDKPDILKVVTDELKGQFDDFKIESSEMATIDNLRAVRILSSAHKTIETSPAVYGNAFGGGLYSGGGAKVMVAPAQSQLFEFKMILLFISGSNRGYVVAAMTEAGQFKELAPKFEDAIASFRVLDRPWPFAYAFNTILGILNRQVGPTVLLIAITAWFRWLFKPSL